MNLGCLGAIIMIFFSNRKSEGERNLTTMLILIFETVVRGLIYATSPLWVRNLLGTIREKGGHNIKEKLDRFLANPSWMNLCPKAIAVNSGFFGSDHKCVKLQFNLQKWVRKDKPPKAFTFESKLLVEDDFLNVAKYSWNQAKDLIDLPSKLKQCGTLLLNWADKEVGNTKKRIDRLAKEIEALYAVEDDSEDFDLFMARRQSLKNC